MKEVFAIAVGLEAGERDSYLTRVCETDGDLRDEVESLIEAHEASDDLLETPILQEPADPMLGVRLGPYEIVERIGSGGMGSVYRAVRVDEAFQKEVAIKVVRRGLDLDRVVRQFRRERQITASLEHPHIANLIDGGTTVEGLPYFVMEFIRGKPIDDYCEEMSLSTRERLELFASVCRAVQFAHERGVVHRDIKPGNILVTGDGIPKLLDFGIAKILNPEIVPSESIVTVGQAMTPEYASPEQLSGRLVTEASDIYSLGVVLYELLTGQRPIAGRGGLESGEAPPPSSTKRGRDIHRDLDSVVLMAMRTQPERRYPSAAAFEADIRRYLDCRPVQAGKASVRNRVSRLLARNKAVAVSAGAAIAVTVAFLVGLQVRSRWNDAAAQPQIIPVTSLPGTERQPYFSPDGKKIVYAWSGENGENSDLYIQSLEDGAVQRITTDTADDLSPVWSPDGSRIAWLRTGGEETAIFVANVGGGPHRKLVDVYPVRLEAVGRHLDWSPDGEYVAAADKSQPDEPFHIILIRVKDGSKSAVTMPPEKIIGDMSPAFSRDGRSIAFLRATASGVDDVYIAPIDGGPTRRITHDNRNVQSLTWTPDGRSIVFSSDRRRNSVLWRVPASGGDPERVPGIAENAGDPVFSREGRLAYTQFSTDANIWRIDTQGKGPAVKVISSTAYDSSPQYSPDGSRVAFRSNRSGSNEIWVSDSNGRTPVQLTHYSGPLTGTPRWSPDGMNIAFDTRPDGQADIYVVSSFGGAPRRVTKSDFEDVVPSWSGDGAWIYFASNRTGAWQVWRTPAAAGAEEQVTTEGGFSAFESPDGQNLYYAKGRSTAGLWRKKLPKGLEEPVLEELKPGFWGYWAVVEDGIYFADQVGRGSGGIFFYPLNSRKIRQVFKIEKPLAVTDSAFAISPEGRHILYTQIDQSGSDILMLERYR